MIHARRVRCHRSREGAGRPLLDLHGARVLPVAVMAEGRLPPHSRQSHLRRPCSQIPLPPHSLHPPAPLSAVLAEAAAAALLALVLLSAVLADAAAAALLALALLAAALTLTEAAAV